MDKRISSLRREFSNVKEESFNEDGDSWLEDRLKGDDLDSDDIISTNKR